MNQIVNPAYAKAQIDRRLAEADARRQARLAARRPPARRHRPSLRGHLL